MRSGWVRVTVAVGILLAAGCGKAPAEAPQELGELGLFLFENFDNSDPELMAEGLSSLLTMLRNEDLSVDARDRAVTMPILPEARLGGLTQPSGIDANAQIPIALSGVSTHGLDAQTKLIVEPNQVCIESDSTKWAQRAFLTDVGCFEDGSCDSLSIRQEVRKESPLAKVWFDQFKDYKRVTFTDADGESHEAIIARSWLEESFVTDSGNGSWDQLYHLDFFIDDAGTTRRWFSMWSSIDVSTISDDFYATQVVRGIEEALLYGDEFIDGDLESCKVDRDGAKPDRDN